MTSPYDEHQQDDAAIVKPIQTPNLVTQLPDSHLPGYPIFARLLHPYVNRGLPFKGWLEGIINPGRRSLFGYGGFRGYVSGNGEYEYAISPDFARFLTLMNPTLAGAIVAIAIAEHNNTKGPKPKASINHILFQARDLMSTGMSDARVLHQYLEVEEDYDRWIEGKIVSHKIVYLKEYLRVGSGKRGSEKIVLSYLAAQEIAQHEKTRRGAQVKVYLNYHRRLEISHEEALKTDLTEDLLNATAAKV